MPIERRSRYEPFINLKAAKPIGVTIPNYEVIAAGLRAVASRGRDSGATEIIGGKLRRGPVRP